MSKLWKEWNDLEQAYDKGYDEGHAQGYIEGIEEGKRNKHIEMEPLTFDGSCPSCATKLKTYAVAIEKYDDMVDIAEYCPNCKI